MSQSSGEALIAGLHYHGDKVLDGGTKYEITSTPSMVPVGGAPNPAMADRLVERFRFPYREYRTTISDAVDYRGVYFLHDKIFQKQPPRRCFI